MGAVFFVEGGPSYILIMDRGRQLYEDGLFNENQTCQNWDPGIVDPAL